MKKMLHLMVVAALVACIACMSGCNLLTGFEKDVSVVLNVEGEYSGTYTVNIFNNAIVPEPRKAGYDFMGWTLDSSYEVSEEATSELPDMFPEKGLIHYNDVKDALKGNSLTVNIYAVFGKKPVYDFVVGWYAKTGTTGLTQTMMDNYKTALYAFLTENGYAPDTMLIDIREYAAELGVADVGMEVNEAGDVDILLGMGGNITSTGGIETLERENDYMMGGKKRNVARLTDDELAILVFDWMKTDAVRAIFA